MLVKLTANKKGALNIYFKMQHELAFQQLITDKKDLVLKGKAVFTDARNDSNNVSS